MTSAAVATTPNSLLAQATPVASPVVDPATADTPIAATKEEDLATATTSPDGSYLTTPDGVRVDTTNDTLKAGERGPSLMQDFHFQEKLQHFDRERIPERVVHARGYGAHGVFTLSESCADVTSAQFLQEVGTETPVFVRFSTVQGFRGSPDNVRDVRGFAVKFYTQEGNFDLVGNDLPVFFIQDAMKFPDFVHSVKPEPDNEMPQGGSAHDTFWDFVTLQPEATHQVMWAMSDRGIPRSLRTIDGFGVHSFIMTTADGKASFVKFHWKSRQGVRSNIWDEHQKIAGKNSDFHRQDLWDAIEAGNFPSWDLGLQVVPVEDEFKFDFDLLDPTKIIPEEEVPVRIVGTMTLNRNPVNFFSEVEQVALHPGRFVPGIGASNDPLLQGRLFSYMDTQMYRLGGPNFSQLPINRPLAQVHTNERDGQHQTQIFPGKASYFPNTTGAGFPTVAPADQGAYVHYAQPVEGEKMAKRAASFMDHYSQGMLLWNSLNDVERQHMIDAFSFELSKVKDPAIRERAVAVYNNVDNALAGGIAENLGIAAPAPVAQNNGKSSKFLSIDMAERVSIAAAHVAVLVADGYDAQAVAALTDAITAEGATVDIVTPKLVPVTDLDGNVFTPKSTLKNATSVFYDATIVAGGEQAAGTLAMSEDAIAWVKETFRHFKPLLALGEGVSVLQAANLNGPTLTAGDAADAEMGVFVGDATTAPAFVQAVYQGRFWNRNADDAKQ